MGFCYFYRALPWLDPPHIARLKRIFYAVIVEAKSGLGGIETTFDFKYVPEYETVTEMGGPKDIELRSNSVERRNLKALGICVGVLGLGAWVSLKITSSLLRSIW
jgi:hypothetical protein